MGWPLVWSNQRICTFSNQEIIMKKQSLIDAETMANATASVSKLPTLKSATAAAVVTVVLAALPAISLVFPPILPFVGAINAVAKIFGYGA